MTKGTGHSGSRLLGIYCSVKRRMLIVDCWNSHKEYEKVVKDLKSGAPQSWIVFWDIVHQTDDLLLL